MDNLVFIVDQLNEDSKAAILRLAQYLAALPGPDGDEDRIRRVLVGCDSLSEFGAVGAPRPTRGSSPDR